MADDDELTAALIAKRLASCNAPARRRAVHLLVSWLPDAPPSSLSDADLLKVWKGVFYAFWHADKLPAQLGLASRLASLVESLDPPLASRYLDAFLVTMHREWPGIDFLRLDKFYLLIRRFLRHLFAALHGKGWDLDLSISMATVLFERSLLSVDKCSSMGVNYHISEIFLDEIKDFLPVPLRTFDALLNPFFSVLEKSSDKVLVSKIKTHVFLRLLGNGEVLLDMEKKGQGVESSSEQVKLGKIALSLGFSKKLFESASGADTLQGNRKVLFDLHANFLKLEKECEKSGNVISMEEVERENGGQVHEVVKQVGVELGGDAVDCGKQPSKKKKKMMKKNRLNLVSECTEMIENGKKKKPGKKSSTLVSVSADKESDCTDVVELGLKNGKNSGKKPSNEVSVSADMQGRTKKKNKSKSLSSSIAAEPACEGNSVVGSFMDADNSISCQDAVMSNLQKEFEKIAAETGNTLLKKRKRSRILGNGSAIDNVGNLGSSGGNTAKKVRFAMNNNLVWKPNNGPMPPQSLRLPPSATPRGSALKKGVPPGPITEIPPGGKLISVKKPRKMSKSVSRTLKRMLKLRVLSS